MPSSFRIGKIAGIDINVHWSWLFIFALLTWSFAAGILADLYPQWTDAQRWAAGVIVSIVFFASVLIHELSHSLMALRLGIPVKGITLFVFGGVSNLGREAQTPSEEFVVAVVGPLASLLLGFVFFVGWLALMGPANGVAEISKYLAVVNGIIAVFNMLPGFPLDGGRVFRSFVWWRNRNMLRATRTASRVGEGLAFLLIGAGIVNIFFFGLLLNGIWLALIGMFLRGASTSSYQQLLMQRTLEGLTAATVARPDFETVPPDITLQELVDARIFASGDRCFAVVAGRELAGMITLTDVKKLPRESWPTTTVWRAMTPFEKLRTVSAREDLARVLQIMGEADINQVPVVEGRLIVGMVSRSDIIRQIQIRRDLGAGAAA
jgi:Zn-dependent protease/CBS domain-containing protein